MRSCHRVALLRDVYQPLHSPGETPSNNEVLSGDESGVESD